VKRLVRWFASNRIAANLLMVFVLAAGLVGATTLRQETFPNVAFGFVSVTVAYPGAAPDEIEEAICVRIEEAVGGVKGIHRSFSRATEGFGAVWMQVQVGEDPRRVLEEVRTRIDALDTLPEGAEVPVVQELIDDHVLISVAIHGETDEHTLHALGERFRDEVSALPEVSRAELVGARDYEIAIEVSEAALRRHGLTFDDVAGAVRASSVDLPGGSLKTSGGEILMRARGRAYRGDEFERLVLLTHSDGARVQLGEVAWVRDGFVESDEHVRFDGEPAVFVRLLTSEPGNVPDVAGAVHTWLDQARVDLPPGVSLDVWGDESLEFEGRRDLLLRNGEAGLFFILAILALFLRLRLAFWVTMGIPIAFLGALMTLALLGVSINMMSMFAFIVALGLVVDDAIIVGENAARHQSRGGDPVDATVAGVLEVSVPVVIAVLTTMLFIAPCLSLPTTMGKITYSLGVVVIACLAFSLVEALLILPAHLAHGRDVERASGPAGRWLHRAQVRIEGWLENLIERRYRPVLERALRRPALCLALAAAVWFVSIGAVAGSWIRYAFLPYVEIDRVYAELEMPEGTPPEAVEAAMRHLETQAVALGESLAEREGHSVVLHVLAAVGDRPDLHDDLQGGGDGPNVVHVAMELVPGEERVIMSYEVEQLWRERVGVIPGALSLLITGSEFGFDRPIDISVSGVDPVWLQAAASQLEAALAEHPGVREIANSQSGGKQELSLRIRPEAEALGLTTGELARQLRQGFYGEQVQRVQRGREDVAVVVRYPASERRSLRDLENAWIRVPGGGELPFSAVAEARVGTGYASVERRDHHRNISVTADVDRARVDPQQVLGALREQVFPRLLSEYPGLVLDLDGQSREEAEMMASLGKGFALAMLAAYALLAVPLRSYLQPLLILAAIPFGFVGAVVGHAVLGLQMSAFSMIGFVALTGVVVNDALLLIDRANQNRAAGMEARAALVDAAVTRFRPILLTSLTTFFGLLPLIFERSAQALWLKPMVATLAFGVVFATVVTLVIVPAAYLLLEAAVSAFRAPFPCQPRVEMSDLLQDGNVRFP
jgi:multidrug efflux pump subunit AcrB